VLEERPSQIKGRFDSYEYRPVAQTINVMRGESRLIHTLSLFGGFCARRRLSKTAY
jgi:hypothetical protein